MIWSDLSQRTDPIFLCHHIQEGLTQKQGRVVLGILYANFYWFSNKPGKVTPGFFIQSISQFPVRETYCGRESIVSLRSTQEVLHEHYFMALWFFLILNNSPLQEPFCCWSGLWLCSATNHSHILSHIRGILWDTTDLRFVYKSPAYSPLPHFQMSLVGPDSPKYFAIWRWITPDCWFWASMKLSPAAFCALDGWQLYIGKKQSHQA